MSPARLAEQRRMLPPAAYLRLWENVWSSGLGDALSPEDIEIVSPKLLNANVSVASPLHGFRLISTN